MDRPTFRPSYRRRRPAEQRADLGYMESVAAVSELLAIAA